MFLYYFKLLSIVRARLSFIESKILNLRTHPSVGRKVMHNTYSNSRQVEVFEIGTETKVRLRLNGKEVINNKLETEYLVLDK